MRHLRRFVSVLIAIAPVCTHTELLSALILFVNVIYWTVMNDLGMPAPGDDIYQVLDATYILFKSATRSGSQDRHSTYGRYLELITVDNQRRTYGCVRLGSWFGWYHRSIGTFLYFGRK